MALITQLLLGAFGGNIGGVLIKRLSLGTPGNSIAGAIGCGMCGQIAQSASSIITNSSMLGSIVGGVAGGILLMILVGIIKRSLANT